MKNVYVIQEKNIKNVVIYNLNYYQILNNY